LDFTKEQFKKLFPNLAKELDTKGKKTSGNSLLTNSQIKNQDRFRHYTPDIYDFLRRCDTTEQAEAIITFMVRNGKIQKELAERLQKQLEEKGIRSFGPKKSDNYYLNNR
jgi:hypothetical protein